MKKIALCTAALATMAFSTPSMADGIYAGVGYNNLDLTSESAPGFKANVDLLSAILGYKINPNLAVEGRIGAGVNDDTFGASSLEVDSYMGANVLGTLPLSAHNWSLYGTLGYGYASFKGRANGVGFKDDKGSLNYGAGVMYSTGPYSVRAGYEALYDRGNSQADGFALTATYAF
ncbi:porin family protein [Limnobacter humi]|uniref:Porin family protein n=1 Tax=Limnobacter humi TaxID=1778671 RepID=A0ABT1WG88_9BURK|nr:porin family protein [Limnobacter humi]MCQ8895434.1 porin family protein [Limnobacter humi]